ncbi:putative ORF-2 [Olavius sp. associated proteobacterium Delta 1]|nr:putative ORF-2 [Olavius sp. associated proteobacterium Delta 1]
MPEISRFYGIVIKMFFNEHNPPHFHASYGEHEVLIDINTLAVFAGNLPPRALGLVIEWATQHQNELINNWDRAEGLNPLSKIEPLK